MQIEVTRDFKKAIDKNPQLLAAFQSGLRQALENPGKLRTKHCHRDVRSLDLANGQRALFVRDAMAQDGGKSLVPFFVGSHADYEKTMDRLRGDSGVANILAQKRVVTDFKKVAAGEEEFHALTAIAGFTGNGVDNYKRQKGMRA